MTPTWRLLCQVLPTVGAHTEPQCTTLLAAWFERVVLLGVSMASLPTLRGLMNHGIAECAVPLKRQYRFGLPSAAVVGGVGQVEGGRGQRGERVQGWTAVGFARVEQHDDTTWRAEGQRHRGAQDA